MSEPGKLDSISQDLLKRAVSERFDAEEMILVPLLAVAMALAFGAVVMLATGVSLADIGQSYVALFTGSLGSVGAISETLTAAAPLTLAALGIALGFRAGLFNIGAEGQLLAGGVTAAWVGTWGITNDLPAVLAIPLVMIAGMLGGGFWGGVPGVLRAKTGAHEVISTIMLNSVALFYIRWMVNSRDPVVLRDLSSTVPRTEAIADSAELPEFVDSQPNLHLGLLIMILACVVLWVVMNRTTFGFEVRTVGTNPHAASYAGIGVDRIIILSMVISGAMAGLAATSEVAGTNGFFQPGTFAAMGFDGIAIALLARANPLAIIPAALLWGSMLNGAPLMQQEADVSIDIVRIIQAMVLLFVAADAIVRFVFRLKSAQPGSLGGPAATGWGK